MCDPFSSSDLTVHSSNLNLPSGDLSAGSGALAGPLVSHLGSQGSLDWISPCEGNPFPTTSSPPTTHYSHLPLPLPLPPMSQLTHRHLPPAQETLPPLNMSGNPGLVLDWKQLGYNSKQQEDDSYGDTFCVEQQMGFPFPPTTSHVVYSGDTTAHKRHSTPATLVWMDQHYHLSEGVCIPRNSVYFNYVDFCSKNKMTPVNAASFGKIIRQMFPHLTTRRLGTRGQSRYHYYGLAVKESSPYYNPGLARREALTQGSESRHSAGQCKSTLSPHLQSSTLPEFPRTRDLKLPYCVPADRLNTFLAMYRVHCQHMYEAITRYNFSDLTPLLSHFWSSIPHPLSSLFFSTSVVSVIGLCDTILYRAAVKAVLPNPIQPGAECTRKAIRKFAVEYIAGVKASLNPHADLLRDVKCKLAGQFAKLLLRRTSVNQLVSATSPMIIATCGPRLQQDWRRVQACQLATQVSAKYRLAPAEIVNTLLAEWSSLVASGRRLEEVCMWLTAVVDRLVVRNTSVSDVKAASRIFVRAWTEFSSEVMQRAREARISSGEQLKELEKLLSDLVLHEIEKVLMEETGKELLESVSQSTTPRLEDTSYVESLPSDFISQTEMVGVSQFEDEQSVPSPDSTQNQNLDGPTVDTDSLPSGYSEGSYSWHQPGQEYGQDYG